MWDLGKNKAWLEPNGADYQLMEYLTEEEYKTIHAGICELDGSSSRWTSYLTTMPNTKNSGWFELRYRDISLLRVKKYDNCTGPGYVYALEKERGFSDEQIEMVADHGRRKLKMRADEHAEFDQEVSNLKF